MADTLRLATWHVELTRRGPGLLLRDILKGEDPAVEAVTQTVAEISPDVLLLTGIDWDLDLAALNALAKGFAAQGASYPHLFASQPNSGRMTSFDLDGDGRMGGPGDAQGFGRFTGNGGMALLSRMAIERDKIRDFSDMRWMDVPDAGLPEWNDKPYPSAQAIEIQKLSSTAHWDIPIAVTQTRRLHILAFAAGPPVFDGPEDRNGLRNHDEVNFWASYLDGGLGAPPDHPVVIMGNANLDPMDGQGRRLAIRHLLDHPQLQDPQPKSAGAMLAAAQAGANDRHLGDPALDTVDWTDDPGPGNLRVSYVLPDRSLTVLDAGVFWPAPEAQNAELVTGADVPRHRLVWVDIKLPP